MCTKINALVESEQFNFVLHKRKIESVIITIMCTKINALVESEQFFFKVYKKTTTQNVYLSCILPW